MTRIYKESGGEFQETDSLWDALDLDAHSVISLVGAGGKTSTMFRLAEECASRGKCVIVTTSTHIFCPENYPVRIIQKAEELEKEEIRASGGTYPILVAAGGIDQKKNKLSGLSEAEIGRLKNYCDVLLIEADGSRQTPLKIPAGHEPVIVDETEVVIGCVGLSCIGRSWKEGCFRWELMDQIHWSREMNRECQKIEAADVADILRDDAGTRKAIGRREYRIVLNQMDGEPQRKLGQEIVRNWAEQEMAGGQRAGQLAAGIVIAGSCYL